MDWFLYDDRYLRHERVKFNKPHLICFTEFWYASDTIQKMKFSVTDFFSKCDQIPRKILRNVTPSWNILSIFNHQTKFQEQESVFHFVLLNTNLNLLFYFIVQILWFMKSLLLCTIQCLSNHCWYMFNLILNDVTNS